MVEHLWWQKAVFYQIYPRSFADANGDGIGDLPGIISKLDYLQDLGVDAIWLSPHYPSPLWDCGYDVADYYGVAPEYGTQDDFKRLLDGLHQREMRLIIDLVLNHTSDQHPWFIESRSSRDNPKRDWYIWRDGRGDGPPNNWYSTFGGSAWEYDERTGQYYYHFFFKQQPDLNWRNPEVKEAMFNVVRYYLDMGVDGFRLDAIGTLFEREDLADQTAGITQQELYRLARTTTAPEKNGEIIRLWEAMFGYQVEQPEMHDLLRDLRALVDRYPGAVLVGETDDLSYYGHGTDELHMVFNFPLMKTHHLTPEWVRANQKERLEKMPAGAWPCNTFGNHDSPRVYSRFADGQNDDQIARLALAVVLTLKGTPFLYYGEEIGMTDLLLQDLSQFRDNLGLWAYKMELSLPGVTPEEALRHAAQESRDKCRTPMQWSEEPNAGFSPAGVRTWLPVNPNYTKGVNVAAEEKDSGSLLNFYRRLLRVRKSTPALQAGEYRVVHAEAKDYLAFLREIPDGQECLVAMNFSPRSRRIRFADVGSRARVLFSSRSRPSEIESIESLRLEPFEIYIGELI
jgi:alpha-glucosidase